MSKGRLEAFSDGVLAIVITIMVLEFVPPTQPTLDALFELWPKFLSYVLSFAFLGIYWVNHHHLLQAARTVTSGVLWTNMHLLFWLSLIPFATAWMGENSFAAIPVAVYGALMVTPALAYTLLVRALIAAPHQPDTLATAASISRKGIVSLLGYTATIPIALVFPLVSVAIFVVIAAIWVIPDRGIERTLNEPHG